MQRYIAVLHPDDDGSYSVHFPDAPTCVTFGDDFEDAVASAQEALRAHADALRSRGQSLPMPRTLADIQADYTANPDLHDVLTDAVIALIPHQPPAGKVERLNITMDEHDARTLDQTAKALGMTRSGFLLHAFRLFLAQNRRSLPVDG